MDLPSLLEKYAPILRAHALPIVLGVAGLGFLGFGLLQLTPQHPDQGQISFEAASSAKQNSEIKESVKQIAVDVEGAVQNPGVYKLNADSRVQDALIAAGGLSGSADRTKVAQSMNLAAKLVDGAKLYIAKVGEEVAAASDQTAVLGSSTTASGTININQASASDLDALPGVGQVTAQKIIDNRPYASVDELLSKKIVNKGVFEKIKDKLTVY